MSPAGLLLLCYILMAAIAVRSLPSLVRPPFTVVTPIDLDRTHARTTPLHATQLKITYRRLRHVAYCQLAVRIPCTANSSQVTDRDRPNYVHGGDVQKWRLRSSPFFLHATLVASSMHAYACGWAGGVGLEPSDLVHCMQSCKLVSTGGALYVISATVWSTSTHRFG